MNTNELEFAKNTLASLNQKAAKQKAVADDTKMQLEVAKAANWTAVASQLEIKYNRQLNALKSTTDGIKEIEAALKKK